MSSVGAALVLTGGKITVGLYTNSLGILSEAAHSALDLVAAAVTFWAVRASSKPADKDHAYGHGKVENLSALFETFLLLLTCVWIIYEAAHRLLGTEKVEVDASVWAFGVVIVSIVIDYSRSRALKRTADKYQSQALEADALHFSTDIWSSCVVFVGLICVRLADALGVPWLHKADAFAGLGVAVIVVWVSLKLGKKSVDDLMDSVPPALRDKAAEAARVDGVLDVKLFRVRRAGPDFFADVTVTIEPDQGIEWAHEIAHSVETAVREVLAGADVVVHVEPAEPARGDVFTMVRRVAHKHGAHAHEVVARKVGAEHVVELHLEVAPTLSVEQAHGIASKVEADVLAAGFGVDSVVTHIEPAGQEAESREAEPVDALRVRAILDAFAEGTQATWRASDVVVSRAEGELAISFNCLVSGGESICEAHALTERLEKHLRDELVEIGRVVIHVEPEAPE